ncbi:MAG: hypothetical protein JNM07_13050 [Phycisphaerae bacterium]|nr:hypothetical protein [Phycisphaerae bacterium]
MERELAKLPPPRGETAFDGLLDGPTEREIERGLPPEQRPGFEVVLRVPLRHGAFGADDERDAMDRLDGRLERGMSKSKAGMLETREIGGGCAEFFITGPREGPLVRAVRGCLKGVDLPPRTRARVRKEGSAGRGKPVTM